MDKRAANEVKIYDNVVRHNRSINKHLQSGQLR